MSTVDRAQSGVRHDTAKGSTMRRGRSGGGTPDEHVDAEPATTTARPAALDTVAKRIIEQLQEDGRRSYAAIGRAVGLSEAAVRQRVQRLLDAGVMQIVAVTDPLQLGFPRQAMIGVRTSGDLEDIADRLAEL